MMLVVVVVVVVGVAMVLDKVLVVVEAVVEMGLLMEAVGGGPREDCRCSWGVDLR